MARASATFTKLHVLLKIILTHNLSEYQILVQNSWI